MSDDLMSRRVVLNILTEARVKDSILCSPAFAEMLTQRIKKIPTAFDKEKVINEIRSGVMAANDEYIETCDEYYHGMQEAHKIDWKIVEKGGIE